jgi:protein gp37
MSSKSSIEWTERTWNPTVGCNKVSPGCSHCYAEVMAKRLQAMGVNGYQDGFSLNLLPQRLSEPMNRKRPTVYFVNSMSDLFHDKIPESYLLQVLETIRQAPQHIFQILTKRAERMADFFIRHQPPQNVWLGVTAEDRLHGLPRLEVLRQIPAAVRFVSIEPLLEDLGQIDLAGIHWVIVGGESGQKARPMQLEWVVGIQRQCEEQDIRFFFKQWGTFGSDGKKRSKKENGRLLNGSLWDEVPEVKSTKC